MTGRSDVETLRAERFRVHRSREALYSQPRTAAKRRRCDGHLSDRHFIERGDLVVWSSLPPNSSEIDNPGWWHAAFCIDCAPIECVSEQLRASQPRDARTYLRDDAADGVR